MIHVVADCVEKF